MKKVLTNEMLEDIDAYFRASNYLSACQLYLLDNPLLKRELQMSDIKRMRSCLETKYSKEDIDELLYGNANKLFDRINKKEIGNYYVKRK